MFSCHGIDDPYKLRINEVKLAQGLSFIELKKNIPISMLAGLNKLDGYGVIIAKLKLTYVSKWDPVKFLELKGYIDFKGVTILNGQEFGVIDDFEDTRPSPYNLKIPSSNWRIPGRYYDLFKVDDDNIIAIFLTYSPTESLLEKSLLPASSQNSRNALIQYLKANTIDSIFVRGENGPKSCNLIKKSLNIDAKEFIPNTGK